ncbi:hypothetical protein AB5I41_12430 [Sphingomonas sp. MMS24-JH45]
MTPRRGVEGLDTRFGLDLEGATDDGRADRGCGGAARAAGRPARHAVTRDRTADAQRRATMTRRGKGSDTARRANAKAAKEGKSNPRTSAAQAELLQERWKKARAWLSNFRH